MRFLGSKLFGVDGVSQPHQEQSTQSSWLKAFTHGCSATVLGVKLRRPRHGPIAGPAAAGSGQLDKTVFCTGRKAHSACLRRACSSRPLAVRRYCCLLLRGLSGIVISSHPASIKGLRTWFRNLARLLLPTTCINSPMALVVRQFRMMSTWFRLSPHLVPT